MSGKMDRAYELRYASTLLNNLIRALLNEERVTQFAGEVIEQWDLDTTDVLRVNFPEFSEALDYYLKNK